MHHHEFMHLMGKLAVQSKRVPGFDPGTLFFYSPGIL